MTINKAVWLTTGQCKTAGWRLLRATPLPPDEATLFRMEQGREVGALARSLYPDAIFVSPRGGMTTADLTQQLLKDPAVTTLCEASFRAGPLTARADILHREAGGWHVLEVKSSFSNTSDMAKYIDDLAYTVMVLRRSGLSIGKASLMLLSRDFRFGDPPTNLFVSLDKTDEINQRAAVFDAAADGIGRQLLGDSAPVPSLVSACRTCAFFSTDCLGAGIAHSVLDLPGLHHARLKQLSAAGVIAMADVPGDFALNDRQKRAMKSALSGQRILEPGLAAALGVFEWPYHYLDFETLATFLPLYPGHKCHQQVPTQFSIHRRDSPTAEPTHSEFLADATRDCQRELAEALIGSLGEKGSVIVYSGFEEVRIKALHDLFPDLASPLNAILGRLRNLLPIIQDHIYHPTFKGSFSIKSVVPALVPDLSYSALAIGDGDTAITRFARMARGEISDPGAIAKTRQELLEYCKMDTLAMVRLHEALFTMEAA